MKLSKADLKKERNAWIIILSSLLIFILFYQPKIFIQDDWRHLFTVWDLDIKQILNFFKIWSSENLDSLNYYRPISTKLYYFIFVKIYGFNITNFILNNWILFLINVYLAYKLLEKLTKKTNTALVFYCFSIIHFTVFSYVSISEVLIFNIFLILSLIKYIENKLILSLTLLCLALMSRETAIVIPLLLAAYEILINKVHLKKSYKKLLPFFVIILIYIIFRVEFYGLPQKSDVYNFKLGFNVIKNLITYLKWTLNLTGVIKQSWFLKINAVFYLVILCGVIIKNFKLSKKLLFALFYWLICLLPVLFFEDHIDPWNLIICNIGLAIFFSQLKMKKTIATSFWVYYLGFFLMSLNFYRMNHWTVVRANLGESYKNEVIKSCSKEVVFDKKWNSELDFSYYGTLSPKIMCNNKELEVYYAE
jgi:hypothetical protein